MLRRVSRVSPGGSAHTVVIARGDKLDGSAFVRAAGVLLDVMGWVGPGGGEQEGDWDRSALGWDEAWEDEKKEKDQSGLSKESSKRDT